MIRGIHVKINWFLVNKIFAGTKPKYFELKRKLLCAIGYEIGEGTKIVGPLYCSAKLTVGENCWLGRDLAIHGNGSVKIGDNCDIAPQVTFLTGGHEIGPSDRRAGVGKRFHIEVGNGVWIGAGSTMLNSITVGDGVVIAACACVNKPVENHVLVGGVPARIIRRLEE